MSGADPIAHLALALALLLVAGKLGAFAARKAGQSSIAGEILVGVLLGNLPLLGITQVTSLVGDPGVDLLARLGAVLLLFEVGLGQRLSSMLRVGKRAAVIAAVGVTCSFLLGWAAAAAFAPAAPTVVHIFLGASLTSTSVSIGVGALRDLVRVETDEARLVIGAAVVDDVMGLGVLSAVAAVLDATVSPGRVVASLGGALAFLIAAVVLGGWLGPRIVRAAARLRQAGAQLGVALALAFVLAWASSAVGLAAIVGAFAAGLVLEPDEALLAELRPITSLLAPLFFISMGLRTHLAVMAHPKALALAAALAVAAVVGKLACAVAAGDVADRWTVAFGMIPRGEVQLVYATLGASLLVGGVPVVGPTAHAALVLVVLVTTLLGPSLMKWRLLRA